MKRKKHDKDKKIKLAKYLKKIYLALYVCMFVSVYMYICMYVLMFINFVCKYSKIFVCLYAHFQLKICLIRFNKRVKLLYIEFYQNCKIY